MFDVVSNVWRGLIARLRSKPCFIVCYLFCCFAWRIRVCLQAPAPKQNNDDDDDDDDADADALVEPMPVHLAEDAADSRAGKRAPFGAVLGIAPEGVLAFSSHYASAGMISH